MMQLSVVSVPVADQDRAKAFYEGVLGFRVIRDVTVAPDRRWVRMAPPAGNTSISLVTWYPGMPPGSIKGLALNTIDIETVHEKLTAKGLAISSVESAPWGRFATFSDPDGNEWQLSQPNNQM